MSLSVSVKRDSIWQKPHIERMGKRLDAFEFKSVEGLSFKDTVAKFRTLSATGSEYEKDLLAVLGLLRLLNNLLDQPRVDAQFVRACYGQCRALLAKNGVDPDRSQLRFLYEELNSVVSTLIQRAGDDLGAILTYYQGGSGNPSTQVDDAIAAALTRISLDTHSLKSLLTKNIEKVGPSGPGLEELRYHFYRLSAHEEMLDHMDKAMDDNKGQNVAGRAKGAHSKAEQSALMLWDQAVRQVQETQNLLPLIKLLRRHRSITPIYEFSFLCYSLKTRRFINRAYRSSSMRRMKGHDIPYRPVHKILQRLEVAYDTNIPLQRRGHEVNEAAMKVDEIDIPELRLLTTAAIARWYSRHRKYELAYVAMTRYGAFCQDITFGRTDDLYGLFRQDTAEISAKVTQPFQLKSQISGNFRRQVKVSAVGLKSLRFLTPFIRRKSPWDDAKTRQLADYLEVFGEFAGVMKGPLMKIAQMASYYGFYLPPETQELLGNLQDRSVELPHEDLFRVAEQSLGQPIEKLFESIDTKASATGSIGQLYRGVDKQGQQVAFKVQYPSIDLIVKSDLNVIKAVKGIFGLFLPNWDFDSLYVELKRVMNQECDYIQESQNQKFFRDSLGHIPNLHIPQVFEHLTSKRTLGSEFFEGRTFREFCLHGTQESRNEIGKTIFRAIGDCVLHLRAFNTDVHPGNFLVGEDRLCMIDFGSVKYWDEDKGTQWKDIIRSLLQDEYIVFKQAFANAGCVVENYTEADYQRSFEILHTHLMSCIKEPMPRQITLDAVRRDIMAWTVDHPVIGKHHMPPDDLYGFRLYWGAFALLGHLQAENRWDVVFREVERRAYTPLG